MRIASVTAPGRGATDRLLCTVAARLAPGMHLAGVVQSNTDRPGGLGCDMDVRVLPGGPVLRISQSLGSAAMGCRLDVAALEEAVALVAASLDAGAGLLILNKFGKHEAAGRGFRPVIAAALEAGIPVLIGLNATNRAAFYDFTGGLAAPLTPEEEAILAWVRETVPA